MAPFSSTQKAFAALLAFSLTSGLVPTLWAAPPVSTAQPNAQASANAQAPAPPITKTVLGLTFTFAPLPPLNGYDALRKAGAALQPLDEEMTAALARNDEAAQRQYVTSNALALSRVRQALQLPYQAPPPIPSGLGMNIDEFQKDMEARSGVRKLASLLQAEGAVALRDGDVEGAINSALDTMLLSVTTARSGSITDVLSAAAKEEVGRRQIWALLPKLSAEQAHYVQEQLLSLDARRSSPADMFYADKYKTFVLLEAILRDWKWEELGVVEREAALQKLDEGAQNSPDILLLNQEGIAKHVSAVWDAQIDTLRQPYTLTEEADTPQHDTFLSAFTNDSAPFRSNYELNRANTRLLMVALGLRAYERDKGQLPATLADLSPAYLAKPVTDPFTPGKAFSYKPDGQKFTLYSVGPNGKDDGGQKGDLVAPLTTFAP